MDEPRIPAGRIAFYIEPESSEIYYSAVNVTNRYADGFVAVELPRGEPDDFYVHPDLPEGHPHKRIAVEHSKEHKALEKLGITAEGDPLALLVAHGYVYERTEPAAEAAARELHEEHGFNEQEHGEMVVQRIVMLPFRVRPSYGSEIEYRDFVHIEGDIGAIALKSTPKTEHKALRRRGCSYTEEGTWATLRDIRQSAEAFAAIAEAETGEQVERIHAEAEYLLSIVEWLETAEAALVGLLRKQRLSVTTASAVDPAEALRRTGAQIVTDMEKIV